MRWRVAEIAPPHGLEQAGASAADARRAEARLRDSDLFLLVLALAVGVGAGISVVLIDLLLALLRWLAFGISKVGHLSDIDLGWPRVLAMPVLGGLLIADEVVDIFLPVRFFWVRRARWLKMHKGRLLPTIPRPTAEVVQAAGIQ